MLEDVHVVGEADLVDIRVRWRGSGDVVPGRPGGGQFRHEG